jgi:hypothetical protein
MFFASSLSQYLQRNTPNRLDGTPRLRFDEQGITYEFDAPLGSVVEDAGEDKEPLTL